VQKKNRIMNAIDFFPVFFEESNDHLRDYQHIIFIHHREDKTALDFGHT